MPDSRINHQSPNLDNRKLKTPGGTRIWTRISSTEMCGIEIVAVRTQSPCARRRSRFIQKALHIVPDMSLGLQPVGWHGSCSFRIIAGPPAIGHRERIPTEMSRQSEKSAE